MSGAHQRAAREPPDTIEFGDVVGLVLRFERLQGFGAGFLAQVLLAPVALEQHLVAQVAAISLPLGGDPALPISRSMGRAVRLRESHCITVSTWSVWSSISAVRDSTAWKEAGCATASRTAGLARATVTRKPFAIVRSTAPSGPSSVATPNVAFGSLRDGPLFDLIAGKRSVEL